MWWKGPAWLQSSPKNFPKFGTVSDEEFPEECSREFKETERNSENVAHIATTVNLTKELAWIRTTRLTEAIDCEQFNDATKLFRVTVLSLQKSGITRNKGHRCPCIHARRSGFRRPVVCEDHQRYSQNIHLLIYMCYVKSNTPGTSPRLILRSVH